MVAIINLCKLGVTQWPNVINYVIIVFSDPENIGINIVIFVLLDPEHMDIDTKIKFLRVLDPEIKPK